MFFEIPLVIGIVTFKGMLESSGAVENISVEMEKWGVPLIGVAMLVPFFCGFITGIAIGFVGSSFPLVVALVHSAGLGDQMGAYCVLAYGFGYMGMMVSPIHLCLLLTRQYWKAPLQPIYRKIAGPCISVALTSLVLFFLYSL